MAKISLKLNSRDLSEILHKGQQLENLLTSVEGPIYHYMLTVSNGYVEAVVSGMGKTTTGMMTLKSFLGTATSVTWKENSRYTLNIKKQNNWSLAIWKASGETESAVKVFSVGTATNKIDLFSGIDGGQNPEAYDHAIRTEFGAIADNGKSFNGRALFTLLNSVFEEHYKDITKEIIKAIQLAIVEVNWGH